MHFINFHLTKHLVTKYKYNIVGIDNINNYYDVKIKKERLGILSKYNNFIFEKIDLNQKTKINNIFKNINLKL